jgi:hypothetical protein
MVEAFPSTDPGGLDRPPPAPSGDPGGVSARLPEWRRGLPLLVAGGVLLALAIGLLVVHAPLFAMRITLWPNLLLLGLIGIGGGLATAAVPWDAPPAGGAAATPTPGTVEVPRDQWEDLVRAFGRGTRAEVPAEHEPGIAAAPEPAAELPPASGPSVPIATGPGSMPSSEPRRALEPAPLAPTKARPVRDYSRAELESEVDKIIGDVRGGAGGRPVSLATVSAGAFRCRACFTRFPAGAEQTPCSSCHRPICAACLAKSVRDGHPGLCPSCVRAAASSGPSRAGPSGDSDNV